ncbi:MAG TPA: class I SAM-dependent DNA methyltransferase [Desulfobacteraceae bacterium]|nr:class I SAM-dependent DNA methyltransferase [Desulfobacteraceae bacterium]HPJ67087.1 class I SAM-dependent DNA methyltransferase [Desulfobacteraceae bacterium]HPQ29213.1 class I SAM-dependent DNA methyltransferase [Desulfobacteraceae bacterium]
MPKGRKTKTNYQPLTTAQQLGSLIKSARDIMRKDKGLNGDLDRLPLFTWVMFLKFLDDMEQLREQEAMLSGEKYKPDIEKPYRWRDWASSEDGFTGEDLIRFVNQDEVVRPDGKKGMGLLAYLRSLQSANGHGRRDVIANVFRGIQNRMVSGYLLRDVVNKVNGIHFNSSEEIHTLSHLYETMLREMRDAAGDSGEFYTPRPVVQFMVEVSDPKLGETVLDPACGTGGFLVEAYRHLEKQCHSVKDRRMLQERSIYGQEAKPLPYMLCQMNLLLHGLEYPRITYDNSLNVKVQEIGDRDRVDVILTNPPFGGEEEAGIKSNFPDDLQTSETALLFLQLHMRLLKRPEKNNGKPGRAAVVVPNGTLFGDGVCARIKERLLKEFNLHTIVRLPNGVFAPYTGIPTNLLFFDRSGPTKTIWYYEVPLPEGRKNYTKTKPMQFEEFADCIAWFKKKRRDENDYAWNVEAEDVLKYNGDGNLVSCNLDMKNPNSADALEHLPPEKLAADILKKERRIIEIMEEIAAELGGGKHD